MTKAKTGNKRSALVGNKRPALGLAGNLAYYRRARHLSQTDLAELAGLSQTGVSKIERGDILDVRTRTVGRLALALNVATAHLTAIKLPAPSDGRVGLTPDDEILMTWFALLRPPWKDLVIEFARLAHRHQEKQERDATAARDTPSEPFGPDVKR